MSARPSAAEPLGAQRPAGLRHKERRGVVSQVGAGAVQRVPTWEHGQVTHMTYFIPKQ